MMKIYLFPFLLLTLISVPASAQNSTLVHKVKSGGMVFDFMREKKNGKTTLSVEIDHTPPPLWSKTLTDFAGGGSILDSWHLLDGYAKGNEIALLLSTESDDGLYWVKATKTNGVWTTDFEQDLYAATTPQRHPGTMALNGTDRVVIVDDKGVGTFTRNAAGDVLRNGVYFQKSQPFETLDKP